MKTIATAAVLMMLAVPAWADEPQKQANDPANTDEPLMLSEAEMDGVTAGSVSLYEGVFTHEYEYVLPSSDTSTTGNIDKFVDIYVPIRIRR